VPSAASGEPRAAVPTLPEEKRKSTMKSESTKKIKSKRKIKRKSKTADSALSYP